MWLFFLSDKNVDNYENSLPRGVSEEVSSTVTIGHIIMNMEFIYYSNQLLFTRSTEELFHWERAGGEVVK